LVRSSAVAPAYLLGKAENARGGARGAEFMRA
jgi:hypothetical protein